MASVINKNGKVRDDARIDYMTPYLKELMRASDNGVDVRGYFYWSFLDNFEWACGYRARFGLVYIDYKTQQRIPKTSYNWYKKVIKTNGKSL
jgi:beta-glucosidase